MSWIIAFVGFASLVVLHELGHFAAAKAVGMRVEKFSLFFGPMLAKFTRGETTYGIGPIPLGGYVKITGMSPREEIPEEHLHRAYYRQPVWKRIVVIVAGPVVNIVLAFVILTAVLLGTSETRPTSTVTSVERGAPASGVLRAGDRIVEVDGRGGAPAALIARIGSHGCAGRDRIGCTAQSPAAVTVVRDGSRTTFALRPKYSIDAGGRPIIGVSLRQDVLGKRGLGGAAGATLDLGAEAATATFRVLSRLFVAEEREKLSGPVGNYELTRRAVSISPRTAFYYLGMISFALGLINLLPLLPLDGGHILWALVEKVRGRAVSFKTIERASIIGLAFIGVLMLIGLQNDIWRIQNGTLGGG